MIGISRPEKDWQAESDLKTLVEAEKIKSDKKRLKAAMDMKQKLKKELEKIDK